MSDYANYDCQEPTVDELVNLVLELKRRLSTMETELSKSRKHSELLARELRLAHHKKVD